jgi:multimeric flavodoxin WrbA
MSNRTEEYLGMQIDGGVPLAGDRIKVLAIVGGPIKQGNTQWACEALLSILESYGNIDCELINLQDKRIEFCKGCEFCMKNCVKNHLKVGMDIRPAPISGYNCSIKDDVEQIHQKMLEADGIVYAAPTYISSIPGNMKNFIDRTRTFVHDYRLTGKLGTAITVQFFRNCGGDVAHSDMIKSLRAIGVMTVSGAILLSSKDGAGVAIKTTRFAVSEDTIGISSMTDTANNLARLLQQMKAGQKALDIDYNKPWKHHIHTNKA